jgi:hypothetical protein
MSSWVFKNSGSKRETNIFYSLLPYIEQQNLANLSKTQRNEGYFFPGAGWTDYCVTIGQDIVKVYLCPSDGTNSTHLDPGSVDNYGPLYATGSYSANVMVFDPNPSRGIVPAMPNGTSNTIIFGHRLEYCNFGSPVFGYNDWDATPDQTGTYHPQPGFGYGTYFNKRGNYINNTTNQQGGGLSPLRAGAYPEYTHGLLPFQIQPAPGRCDPVVLASPHTGAMVVGLGDGSVRTITPGISLSTWLAACIPDSGVPLGSDW